MKDIEDLARKMRERALERPEPWVVYEKIYEPSEEQKKLYFHAGRWAGGARDYNARQAMEKLHALGEF